MSQINNAQLITNLAHAFVMRGDAVIPNIDTTTVSGNPPTDAQLDSAFGPPSELPDPFLAIATYNSGLAVRGWLVVATNNSWYYVALTLAT